MNEIFLDSVDSTQTYAKAHASEFPPNSITCIVADEQTAGHGRHQRKWHSPKGVNLYVTFCFQLPTAKNISCLSHVMTATMAKVLENEGLKLQIKWPNDILLGDKKACGSICETVVGMDRVDVFLGIGVNVNLEEFESIDQSATSLKAATGRNWNRKELLKKLQVEFERNLEAFKKKGFEEFRVFIEKRLVYRDGVCEGLNSDGGLIVRLPDDTCRIIY